MYTMYYIYCDLENLIVEWVSPL